MGKVIEMRKTEILKVNPLKARSELHLSTPK